MHIKLLWDASAAAMPAAMKKAINHAAQLFDHWLPGPGKVYIDVGFNEIAGQHLDRKEGAEGRFNSTTMPYSALEPVLAAHDGGAVLPSEDPTNGAGVGVSNAEAKALGLMNPNAPTVDGYVGFRSEPYYATGPRAQPGKEDFVGIAEHELSEALGRRSDASMSTDANGGGPMTIMDLFRYNAPGAIACDSSVTSYFSTDGGATPLAYFNADPRGDLGDWTYPGSGIDAFRGGIMPDTLSPITPVDRQLMAALGFSEGGTTPK